MADSEVIAGLDLGSGKVTCVIGAQDPDTQTVAALAGASVPCRGIMGGVVLNIAETAAAVGRAVEEAEKAAKKTVHGLYLAVRGGHLQSFNNHGAYNIARTDKQITPEDVAAVVQNAKAIPLSADREILHVLPQGFALDRQRGVPNPVGMEGSLLEVDVHIITASSAHLTNLVRAVGDAGFEVIEPVYGLLAAGQLLVNPEERELGVLVVDFGGQCVSLGIYTEGGIRFSRDLPVGSDSITRDLAIGLQTPIKTAERIKVEHGLAHPKLLNGDAEIKFVGMDARTPKTVSARATMEIILPRVEQIFTAVAEEVANSNFADLVAPIGAVLTGGGSQLKGMAEAAGQILDMPVRLGSPHEGHIGAPPHLLTPTYSTALGLLVYPHGAGWAGAQAAGSQTKLPAWRRRLKTLFQEIF